MVIVSGFLAKLPVFAMTSVDIPIATLKLIGATSSDRQTVIVVGRLASELRDRMIELRATGEHVGAFLEVEGVPSPVPSRGSTSRKGLLASRYALNGTASQTRTRIQAPPRAA